MNDHDQGEDLRLRNRRSGLRWGLLALFMLAMTPPLYYGGLIICNWAGLGLDPAGEPVAGMVQGEAGEATGRFARVYHKAMLDPALEGLVRFTVDQSTQRVEVGRYQRNLYHLENRSDRTLYIHPRHYVSDKYASQSFMMIECFCYNDMALEPGQVVELPVVYGFKPDMPASIGTAHVSYTLFAITKSEMKERSDPPPGFLDGTAP